MEAHGIRRGVFVAAGVALLAATVLVPGRARASGGGGCGRPVTDEAGTTVDIRNYCFSPTILRVATGETVTFTNRDPVSHSVLGANATWGDYDDLKRGVGMTYRFAEPGVYPYVCTFHVGMVGVIVVGSGVGGTMGSTTADGPVTRVASELGLENAASVRTPTSAEDGSAWATLVLATIGILIGAAGATVVHRRHGRSLV
jgi:plastocyanin